MSDGRWRVVKANIPPESASVLDEWFGAQGTTLGAFLEALAESIDDLGPNARVSHVSLASSRVLKRAREIASLRRRRG